MALFKPDAPPPPDFESAAEATAEANAQAQRDATYANRIDQYTPYGELAYESYLDTDPATGEQVTRWRQRETLSPELQRALDAQVNLQGGRSELGASMMGDLQQDFGTRQDFDQYGRPIQMGPTQRAPGAGGANTAFNQVNLRDMPAYQKENLLKDMGFDDPGLRVQNLEKNLDYSGAPDVNAPAWTREAAEKSVYDRGASRLDPQFEQAAEALDVRLRSQGLSPGDESYDKQMANFQRTKTDAYDALNAQAMQEGARQAQSMFGMESAFRDQSTREEDRMKQFRNAALAGQFGIEAQRQAQLFDITKGQAGFTNQALLDQMKQSLAARLGEGQMQALIAQANNSSQAISNAAKNQNFQQGLQSAGFNNQLGFQENALSNALRTQGMSEDMMQRMNRLNETNALLTGQQVAPQNFQNYAQQGVAPGANYLGAADMGYQADMAQYGANNAMWNNLIGGGAQLGAGLAGGGFFNNWMPGG